MYKTKCSICGEIVTRHFDVKNPVHLNCQQRKQYKKTYVYVRKIKPNVLKK